MRRILLVASLVSALVIAALLTPLFRAPVNIVSADLGLTATDAPTPTPATAPTVAASVPPPTQPTTEPTAPAQPTATPEPTAEPIPAGPPRVGIQVGHWKSSELPDELERLRTNTGAFAAGVSEVDVNLAVAQRVVALLEAQGLIVDLLPATIPPSYRADAFVAIHADGSTSAATRGFKIATPWRTSPASRHLLDSLIAEYASATALPQDDAITFNMRGYYAFSSRRFQHAIDRLTPATIVEMGFLSNAADRSMLVNRPEIAATGIANGIVRYLNERDVTDRAALEPPNIAVQRAREDGVLLHASPSEDSRVLQTLRTDQRLIPFELRNGWYQIVVRGEFRVVGWVKAEDVRATDEQLPVSPNQ